MNFEWFVSRRYLRAKRKQKFISLISVISILGVAVGVMALIVVLSVYTGFTEGTARPDHRHQLAYPGPALRRQYRPPRRNIPDGSSR
jgi:hypothetical protein